MPCFQISSPYRSDEDDFMVSTMSYNSTRVVPTENGAINGCGPSSYRIEPCTTQVQYRTKKTLPKLGVMLVGMGGNNGTTFAGVILANKHGITWETKDGVMSPNYFGSMLLSSTTSLGVLPAPDEEGFTRELCVPLCQLVPTSDPNSIEIDGWDISSLDIDSAMFRAKVFDINLQKNLQPYLKSITPRKSIFNRDYLASNQEPRADNILTGTWEEQVEVIKSDIREFKASRGLDEVIVLWTASTERFCDVSEGVNDTAENLLKTMRANDQTKISPSTLFAIASIQSGCCFINGSPQNTLVPGVIQLAEQYGVHVAGDDFKTGQTKIKSALVEFLIGSGIKPVSIVSYNHLGNNDGKNLSAPKQFRSKEITKSGVIDDMVKTNNVLYKHGEKPDHCIVIKYVPYVGDSKRAMDEYISEICMNGKNTIALHNTCEDSLLAVTVMLDLVLLTELFGRISFKVADRVEGFKPVLSALGFLLKGPVTNLGEPSVNSFSRQRGCIENLLRCCAGLESNNFMFLAQRVSGFPGK